MNVRIANVVSVVILVLVAIGLAASLQRRAEALINGPCPSVVNYSTTCPSGTSTGWVHAGYDCAQCDPFTVNGSTYYHCALYDRKSKRCYSYPSGDYTTAGFDDFFVGESGGASTCYPNLYGAGQAGCLAD